MKGTIKRLDEKRYGFISVKGERKDYFFHQSGLAVASFEDLNVGDEVEFDVEESEKGKKAVRITVCV